jgi:hypothetical protein
MRFACLLALVLSGALAACGAPRPGPDPVGDAVTITITSDQAPELVAFQDGISGAWQPATRKTATTFEAAVHGPYIVTIVCKDPRTSGVLTWQDARTPEDGPELSQPCYFAHQGAHAVTGHMVQAGFVQVGSSPTRSSAPDWNFAVAVDSGMYDLIATTADRIAVRRGLLVNGDMAVTPSVDVAQEGTALVDVAFTATNAERNEELTASVGLLNATTPAVPARIYLGPIATAKAAPDAALAATDTQSVSVRATAGAVNAPITTLRALRRTFRIGGNTVFAFPKPFVGVTWTVEHGDLALRWTALPDFELFDISTYAGSGASASPQGPDHTLNVSRSFVEALDEPRLTLDTDIPGFQPSWRVDLTRSYRRDLFAQKGGELGVLATTSVTEQVNVLASAASRDTRAQASGERYRREF